MIRPWPTATTGLGQYLRQQFEVYTNARANKFEIGNGGETAVVSLRDSGISIPQEDLPQLFNRFHRGRNTSNYAGNGLGLAIMQEIMLRHNGQATIQSGEWGTEVQLVLRTR